MNRTLTTEYTEMNDEMRDITVLYARLSKDDGRKSGDSDSIVNQRLLLENFAKSERLTNCVFFADDGISGTTFDRPAFQAAIELVNKEKVVNFIVKDLSRFGRDYLKVGAFTEVVFPEKNVRFIAINDNVDSLREEDNSLAPFRNLFNEWYARDTSKKIKAVKHAKGNAGEPLSGSLPYGYVKGPNYKQTKIWLVDAEAAKIVQRIFQEFTAGHSLMMIAEGLKKDKILIPSRHKIEVGERVAVCGKYPFLWSYDVVGNILENEAYTGAVVNFKTYKKSYKSKKCLPNPREKWVISPGHHEAIIDSETFESVQKMRNSRRTRQTHNKSIGMFSGMIFCADCGCKHHYDQRLKNPTYFCSGRASRLRYCESYHRIREKDLMVAVADDFAKIQAEVNDESGDFVVKLREKFALDDAKDLAEIEHKFRENEARILELDDVISQLYEDNVSGKISDERFAKMSEKFEEEQRGLQSENAKFREKLAKAKKESQNVDRFVALAKKASQLENLTPERVRELLERIEISEKVQNENGEKTQDVRLFYRFVGAL